MAGGGLAVVLHAVEDPFDHVPPLVRLPVAIPWGRTIPLGRRGRRPGGIPLVRAVPGRVRAHERAGRGHRAAPVGRVVPGAQARMGLDDRASAVGCYVNFGVPCVLMLLYIVKRLGVLFWTGDGVNPLDGPSLEFGQVPFASFDLPDAAERHAWRLVDLLWVIPWPTRGSRSPAPRSAGILRPIPPLRMAMSTRHASRAMNRLTQRMFSSLPSPSRVFPAAWSLVGWWYRKRTMAMRRNAMSPCRLPPLLSLCLFVLPLDAGSGHAPQSLANAASLRMRSGSSPATMARAAAMTMPAQYMSGDGLACSWRIARMRSSRGPDCRLSAFHALAVDFSAAGALRSTSPPAGLHSASPFMRSPPLNPRYRSLTDSGAVTSRPLAESGIVVMADASWARWALRWRNASTHPSGLFGGPVPHRP